MKKKSGFWRFMIWLQVIGLILFLIFIGFVVLGVLTSP